MRGRTLGVLLAVLCCAWPAGAQEQRGAVEGVVRDATGAVLPGATVEARNLADGAVLATVADTGGSYRFPALLPGRYSITASMSGFTAAKVDELDITLGRLKRIDLTLTLGGQSESIQVTADTPLVDVKQSAVSRTIAKEQIDLLPKGRDFTTLLTQAAGTNNEMRLGGISIDGASAAENRYVIDGMDTTELVTGTSGKNLLVDFLDQVQVKSSGYTAEYGGATGGVINAITKSGTNRFSGLALAFLESSGMEAARRPTLRLSPTDTSVAEYVTYPEDSYTRAEPGFAIGGPLLRDRAWFFAAYQPQLVDTDRTSTFSLDQSTGTFNEKRRTQYFSVNQTAQFNDKLRTRVSLNYSPERVEGLLPALDGSSTPVANFGKITSRPNRTFSANADYVASTKLYFGVRGGYYYQNQVDENVRSGPLYIFQGSTNIGLPGIPASLQRVSGFRTDVDGNESLRDKRTRANIQADATYYGSFAGQHAIKGGVQFDRLGNDVLSGEKGNRVQLFWNQDLGLDDDGQPIRGQYGYYAVRSNAVDPSRGFITEGNVNSSQIGLFVQDAWSVNNRLTLQLGLRTEREVVPSFVSGDGLSADAIEFSFGDKLAPRLGFSYDVRGDGRRKAYGNWGVYYDIFKLQLSRGAFGGDKWLNWFYGIDQADWTSLVQGGCPPACNGRYLDGPIDMRQPSNRSIDPSIRPMRSQEATFGLEHQLTRVTAVAVRYVHKQLDRAVEDIGTRDERGNEVYTIGNPGEGLSTQVAQGAAFPKAKRQYDSVEFSFDKLYSRNWMLRASYLWSRLYGNYSGLSQSDENGRTAPNVGRSFDYPLMMFTQDGVPNYGPLGTDRPHQFKTQVIYTLPFGTSVGVNEFISSGVPVTREAAVLPTNNYPMQYLGRGSDGRTDIFSQTDLSLQHEFRVGGQRRLQLILNVLNLFNQDAAISKFSTYIRGSGVTFDEVGFYRDGVDVEALVNSQRRVRDARFLMDNDFQMRRIARVGVKFLF